jgi:hypothetical protein
MSYVYDTAGVSLLDAGVDINNLLLCCCGRKLCVGVRITC